MKYHIQKKTPGSYWYTIHHGLDLDTAKEWLEDIGHNYDKDDDRQGDSTLSNEGLFLSCYDGGDLHEYRILEHED